MSGKYAAVITVRLQSGRERQTAADVYGSWAVHRSFDPQAKRWAITQVHSGHAVPIEHTELLTKKQASATSKQEPKP